MTGRGVLSKVKHPRDMTRFDKIFSETLRNILKHDKNTSPLGKVVRADSLLEELEAPLLLSDPVARCIIILSNSMSQRAIICQPQSLKSTTATIMVGGPQDICEDQRAGDLNAQSSKFMQS